MWQIIKQYWWVILTVGVLFFVYRPKGSGGSSMSIDRRVTNVQ